VRNIALQQPTDAIHSGYYRTLFSIESFNAATSEIAAWNLQSFFTTPTKPAPAVESRPPGPAPAVVRRDRGRSGVQESQSDQWAKDLTAAHVSRAMAAIAEENRRTQREFHLAISRTDQMTNQVKEHARKQLARRRRAASILLLAA
jgi:hypothetical protein